MTELRFVQVDAFASRLFEGNPAAVIPLDSWLPDAIMQVIAAENNLSETAFTVPSERDDVDYDLRWFTPAVEVELCGHATLASAHVLIEGGRIRFATRSGVLTVTRGDGGLLQLDLPTFPVQPGIEAGLLEALGLPDGTPTFLGRGGNGAAIALLENEAAVRAVAPQHAALRPFDHLVIVTAPGDATDIVSRVFAVYHGIDEDPVTGSAHALLVPFWAERLGRTRLTALQASRRSGRLDCELRKDRVVLGGHCVSVIEGRFHL